MRNFNLEGIKKIIDDPTTYNPVGVTFLDKRYQEHIDKGGNHLYYRLFYHLAKFLQPNCIVELGGWQGTAAAHFAAGCPDAIIVTIDHHTDLGDEFNKEKMLEADYEYCNLHYIKGWTNDILTQREKGKHALGDAPSAIQKLSILLLENEVDDIDILFIDSWHKYDEAMMDWQAYQPHLASPSLVICDDVFTLGDELFVLGMEQFWGELSGEKFLSNAPHPGYPMGFMKYE